MEQTNLRFCVPGKIGTTDNINEQQKWNSYKNRYGPHFEDIASLGNVTNITVQVGNTVYLNCRISLLQDKTVCT